jgi:hypothetical protein
MSPRLVRAACAALVVAAGLVSVPACKKKKPPVIDDPTPTPAPGPASLGPPPAARDPAAPRTPVFGSGDIRIAAMRPIAQGDLRQIGLALHHYHDAIGCLPGGFTDRNGKPGLSWRVALLPYLEHDGLYRQFKLDEPWDSPNNKPLIDKMPKVFAPPRTDTYGYTFYRGFSGPGTWLPPQFGAQPGVALKGASFAQFTDGTVNTIIVAEAAEAVIWTKPDEQEVGPNKVPQVGGGVFASGAHALFGDGDARFVRKLDPATLTKLVLIADGSIVNNIDE